MLHAYFNTGCYIALDSGFCVFKPFVLLYKKGLYAGALIKKCHYWTTLVPGLAMDARFESRSIGKVDAVIDVLQGVRYNIWGIK